MRRPLLRVFFKTVYVCCLWGVVGLAVPGRVLGGERADFPPASDALTGRAMPLVLVDADGDTLSLLVPPRRLVVVGQAPFIALHLLYAFAEGRKMLVGYERKYNIVEQFLPFLDPALDQKTVLGTNPGFEQIAAWNPNRIFTIVGFNREKCRVMASLKADTKWRGLSALVHGEFHLFSSGYLCVGHPGPALDFRRPVACDQNASGPFCACGYDRGDPHLF